MRSMLWMSAAAVALVSAAAVAPAQAMPLAPMGHGTADAVTLVRDGCGPFGHRSHYGYCKENGDGWGDHDHGGYGEGRGYGEGGYGFVQRRGFYEQDGYREHRCVIRETYDGPVRVCR